MKKSLFSQLLLFAAIFAGSQCFSETSDSLQAQILDETLFHLRRLELDAEAQVERLRIDAATAEDHWLEARKAMKADEIDSIAGILPSIRAAALWEQLKSIRMEIKNTEFLLSCFANQRAIRRQYLVTLKSPQKDPKPWRMLLDSISVLKRKVQKERKWVETRIKETKLEFTALRANLPEQTDSARHEERRWRELKLAWVEKQLLADSTVVWLHRAVMPALDSLQNLAGQGLSRISTSENFFSMVRKSLSLWNYEIRNVQGRSLTVGKIIIALLIVVFGVKLAGLLSRVTANVVKRRFYLEQGVVEAGQKLFFYGFAVLIVVIALQSIQVPLTAFTVAGGALALGIGFGSQTILNNFISGIILLLERPIKTGDFVEVDSVIGIVEVIGLRATRIQTPGNVHLVIPNSSFIEKNVLNWTLADRLIRLELRVGVIYGSPVREVKRLLIAATAEMDRILNKPEPIVLFSDFGDDSLVFDLLFWIKLENIIERRTILSAVRFRVNSLFRQAGIVIAFPQRDVHLDINGALPVSVLGFEKKRPAEEQVFSQQAPSKHSGAKSGFTDRMPLIRRTGAADKFPAVRKRSRKPEEKPGKPDK